MQQQALKYLPQGLPPVESFQYILPWKWVLATLQGDPASNTLFYLLDCGNIEKLKSA